MKTHFWPIFQPEHSLVKCWLVLSTALKVLRTSETKMKYWMSWSSDEFWQWTITNITNISNINLTSSGNIREGSFEMENPVYDPIGNLTPGWSEPRNHAQKLNTVDVVLDFPSPCFNSAICLDIIRWKAVLTWGNQAFHPPCSCGRLHSLLLPQLCLEILLQRSLRSLLILA